MYRSSKWTPMFFVTTLAFAAVAWALRDRKTCQYVGKLDSAEVGIPFQFENGLFNALPKAPACPGLAAKKAGAFGWALNEIRKDDL